MHSDTHFLVAMSLRDMLASAVEVRRLHTDQPARITRRDFRMQDVGCLSWQMLRLNVLVLAVVSGAHMFNRFRRVVRALVLGRPKPPVQRERTTPFERPT